MRTGGELLGGGAAEDHHFRPPRSPKGLRTRSRLLDAAKQVFEEDGFLATRISDIAERAQVSHGSFYHYFDSKEQIFREIAQVLDTELSAPLGDVILAESSDLQPQDRIRRAIALYFESYRDEARILGVIEEVSRYDEHVKALRLARHRHYSDQISESIRQLQIRDLADPTLDPDLVAVALGALTYRFAEIWLVQGAVDYSFEDAVDQVSKIFINALQLKDRGASRHRH